MKKIMIPVFLLFVGCIVALCIYSKQKEVTTMLYSPNEAHGYVMEEDRTISYDVYSKTDEPLILKEDRNSFQLIMDEMILTLELISIQAYELSDIYLLRYKFKMPALGIPEFISDTQILKITNEKYTVELSYGPVSFLSSTTYPLLSLDTLYGSYNNQSDALEFCGVNLILHESYQTLSMLRIGGHFIGDLKLIKESNYENTMIPFDIIPQYSPRRIPKNYNYEIRSSSLFIPMVSKESYLLRSSYLLAELDGVIYYFDTFDYMTNIFDFTVYQDFMKEGIITYA